MKQGEKDTTIFGGRPPAGCAPGQVCGRFAPSPTGRMHLGNIYAAVMSWLAAKSRGGQWLLRIEDLDPQRSRPGYARLIEDDLHWLGLEWDRGGIDGIGPGGPYCQSRRHSFYQEALMRLRHAGLTYPCTCTRAQIRVASAPHASDGHNIYGGRCRPAAVPYDWTNAPARYAERIIVPHGPVTFDDIFAGTVALDAARESGDTVLRRGDGAWAYQLAVVVDDALMGVNQVVRGCDLLGSTPLQIYLQRMLGYPQPQYGHIPLLTNAAGQRLSKRDGALAMDVLRRRHTPASLLGHISHLAGITDTASPVSLPDLLAVTKAKGICGTQPLPQGT